MSEHDGGPAFPHPGIPETYAPEWGMSLRDWFAGQALTGLMGRAWEVPDRSDDEIIELWAVSAYACADAMLKARQS